MPRTDHVPAFTDLTSGGEAYGGEAEALNNITGDEAKKSGSVVLVQFADGYSDQFSAADAIAYVNYRHLRGGGLRLPSGTSAAWCRSRLSSLPCLAAWRGGVCVGVVDCALRARIMFGRDRIAWY